MAQAPSKITLHKKSAELEVHFGGQAYHLPAELLRVYSPSAEVQGHSREQAQLQTGKRHVKMERLEPVGTYAVKIVFDDGHDTGIYTWGFLQELGEQRERYWQDYLEALDRAGESRDPDTGVVKFV